MATLIVPRAEIEKISGKLTDEKLESLIGQFGTNPEKITSSEISLEITPNRPDLLSIQGFLRAFKSYLGKKSDIGLKQYKITKSGSELIVSKSLPKEWPYAYACIIKDLKFDDEKIKEVIDIQEKLGSTMLRDRKKGGIGLYPLEKISFPVTFKGMAPDEFKFRPLEFPTEITGRQILSKHPTGRSYAHICQDWDKFPVFIDSKNKIMSMPPIINSHEMGKIDETTKDVFLEATGTSPQILKIVIDIISTALADMGGQIYSIECIQQNGEKESIPNLNPQKSKSSLENTNKLLGLNLKESDLKKLLPRMGYNYSNGKVEIPAWRADILHESDIIEDIAIAYGYENFTPKIPNVATTAQEPIENRIKRKISELLIGLGITEVASYHLIKPEETKLSKLDKKEIIELEDSKSEYKLLRPNLLIPAMRILSENKDHEYPQKIFEIGTVFKKDQSEEPKEQTETGLVEKENLVIAITPSNFTVLKQIIDYLSRSLAIKLEIKTATHPMLIQGRTAAVILNNKEIGYFGEVHPETLRAWNIKMPIAVLEISLEKIFNQL